jgi:aryl-phospho-beta-D-glucosidase BglC (GH1 family)
VRWQLCWNGFPRSPADNGDLDAYDKWLEGALKHLDELLPLCKELGVLAVVDLHTPPGGRDEANDCRLFQEKRFQDKFLEVWDKMARRYKGNAAVWGYDLVNEPVEGPVGEGLMDWQDLAEKTAKLVRAIDPDHAIIIEPAPWGGIDSLQYLTPINVPGVVYSAHMYQPFQFTHQGVFNNPVGVEYPGMIAGKQWDKDRLRLAFKPVVDFQKDYGVHIYIGEFSAIRWAPNDSACTYLRDVVDIMEEHGWDWAYHAFREWDGWSVEHGSDKKDNKRSPTPTSRQQLLQGWFAKNERAR